MVATSPVSKKPSFVEDVAAGALEIGSRSTNGALDHQVPEGAAVVRQAVAGVVGQLQVDAQRRAALLER
jgi:hypothetical protein